MTGLLFVILIVTHAVAGSRFSAANEKRVRRLIRDWAPLVWLAPGERFLPLGVTEFLDNVQSDQYYLRTRIDAATQVPQFEKTREEDEYRKVHFHVTYWMFYPFSEGKTICVLDLGFFGSWPIPTIGGVCIGTLKEYGSHIGDWEHMSLYFKDNEYPLAMYVSAHDAGAFYQYDPQNGTFVYESQETRKGLFQKPIFPEKVYTADGSHPILFSARGSHGLWTAPGKHKFVRVPRLYDESGFGTAWPTWKRLELLLEEDNEPLPGWMTFKGKWGNPSSNCHPLAKLGFNICEFVDGPTGIPMKQFNFRC
ncbi:vacuolar protein sorting-associated protein 62 isoform X2 [Pogonomyrmex barbatus]|uniref:Vacuolar protein sorting-associated protein 62 isoform X2 n=1 Tax=Pogonomyrmex barbatus TaxID=144034 RepID=A0A8N1SAU0_9HYME|nr:vacuolar protein sorting-associated protein 62 isoform X2 [Pogonomyrmex barbatus]